MDEGRSPVEGLQRAVERTVGMIPGVGAAGETFGRETSRGTNPVVSAVEATANGILDLALPATRKVLENVGGKLPDDLRIGATAVVLVDTALSLAKVYTAGAVGGAVSPEAGMATFAILHNLQREPALVIEIAMLNRILPRPRVYS